MTTATDVTEATLRALPLPTHHEGEDKDSRGRALIIGGGRQVPGAALLAGIGALRAGAGKLQVATVAGIAPHLALALPEALVAGLDETEEGEIAPSAAAALIRRTASCDAAVIGPGMLDGEAAAALTAALLRDAAGTGTRFVLDAAALHRLREMRDALRQGDLAGRVVVTPHAGEMATLLGVEREEVLADRLGAARRAASMLQVVVAMKGAGTYVVAPGGQAWFSARGCVGLATSGSGDTLAGILGGLLARGATPIAATLWAVFLHGEAGERLSRSRGPVGFLAREILPGIPALMAEVAGQGGA
jgi:hydroxyethylthiazole kinase-like uncharacterized protein yjeF